jgi:hypothetical protein
MGGGANPSTHNYPTQVWTPTGGWWCHPKYWRRNTVFAFAGIVAVCIPIAMKSAELEVLTLWTLFHILLVSHLMSSCKGMNG